MENRFIADENEWGSIVLTQVTAEGKIIDSYLLPSRDGNGQLIDYGEFYVPYVGGQSLLEPIWDFEKHMWYEGNPEGALANEKIFRCEMLGWDTIDIRYAGFTYDGYFICCWGDARTQWDTQMMILGMRPTLTSAKLTLGLQTVSIPKDKFFEMYDAIIAFEEELDNKVKALQDIVNAFTLDEYEELKAFPSFLEAVEKYL